MSEFERQEYPAIDEVYKDYQIIAEENYSARWNCVRTGLASQALCVGERGEFIRELRFLSDGKFEDSTILFPSAERSKTLKCSIVVGWEKEASQWIALSDESSEKYVALGRKLLASLAE